MTPQRVKVTGDLFHGQVPAGAVYSHRGAAGAPLPRAGPVPSLSRNSSRCRFALGGTAHNRIRETTVLVSHTQPEAHVQVLRCRGPGVAAGLSMEAQAVARDESRPAQRTG
jgi:hypothetical protein